MPTEQISGLFFQQWQFWAALVNIAGLVILFFFNKFAHDKVVGNDLHHIGADIKSIMGTQVEQGKKIVSMSEDISYLKGSLNIPLSKRMKKAKTIQ